MTKPDANEYASFYARYVELVKAIDGIIALSETGQELTQVLLGLPEEKGRYAYAEGKWSINELVQHMIDSEVIFANRALRIARGDRTKMPGFEQDDYVAASYADYQSLSELASFFKKTRDFTITLFKSFPQQVATNIGHASGSEISLRALCFIIAGHTQHHTQIIKERYL